MILCPVCKTKGRKIGDKCSMVFYGVQCDGIMQSTALATSGVYRDGQKASNRLTIKLTDVEQARIDSLSSKYKCSKSAVVINALRKHYRIQG